MTSTQLPRWIGRALGKCAACGAIVRDDSDFWKLGGKTTRPCAIDGCKGTVTLKAVIGTTSAKECDARCINAKGPSCDCSCGGENHGAGH